MSSSREALLKGVTVGYNDKTDALTLIDVNTEPVARTVWAHGGRIIFGIDEAGRLKSVHVLWGSKGLSPEDLKDGIRYRNILPARR